MISKKFELHNEPNKWVDKNKDEMNEEDLNQMKNKDCLQQSV